jgi:hypothetical protein
MRAANANLRAIIKESMIRIEQSREAMRRTDILLSVTRGIIHGERRSSAYFSITFLTGRAGYAKTGRRLDSFGKRDHKQSSAFLISNLNAPFQSDPR